MDPDAAPTQVWELAAAGHSHRVEVRGSLSRQLRWFLDGELLVERRSGGTDVRLARRDRPEVGAVGVKFSRAGRARRATLLGPSVEPGGTDLVPTPGSPAALHEEGVRAHPQRYAALAALTGAAKVVVPLLLAGLALSLPMPHWDVPWPGPPSFPRPDWSVRWPDLPPVPVPDWSLPGWLVWALEHVHFVSPVVIGYLLARREVRRRRAQDELRATRAADSRRQDA
jgi:hypothetical protein